MTAYQNYSRDKFKRRDNSPPINENIRVPFIILINQNGEKIGQIATKDALAQANAESLDLVIINNNGEVPIAKIMDYGQYLYDLKRKTKESKRKSAQVKTKSINVKPQISAHDLSWKADQAKEWLNDGNRVQFLIKTYGRIATKKELILQTYEKFVKLVETHGTPQANLKKVSNVLYEVFFNPIKKGEKK